MSMSINYQQYNQPLAEFTSWRVGGAAEQYFRPFRLEDLVEILQKLPKSEQLLWLGLGSNILISDAGFAGTVIHTARMQDEIAIIGEDQHYAELKIPMGVSCAKVSKFAAKHGLVGAEFLAGIPGTFGGALAMNAGAFGGETWKLVSKVIMINRSGEIILREKADFSIGYRSVAVKSSAKGSSQEQWFIVGYIKLAVADKHQIVADNIKQILRQRNITQPIGSFSCGSVFKNPEGDYAARLIETSGLKGKKLGNAQISDKHANFIINQGGATAKEIITLIEHVQYIVQQKHKVYLCPEVRIINAS